MKTDYIYKIPAGKELDGLIADRVMYWNQNHEINECEDKWYSYCNICGYEPRFEKIIPGSCKGYPRYSVDISSAWEVVEKMGPSYELKSIHHSSGTVHRATFWRGMMGFSVEAETAPLAICRAALLAIEYELG